MGLRRHGTHDAPHGDGVSIPEDGPTAPGAITADDFLFPKLPGSFKRWDIRKKPLEWLKDRYIQVLMASMANHSMGMFYCCWDQDEFDAILDEAFAARISRVKAELADRATFIMLRGVGLVDNGEVSRLPPTVTSVMAKVVDGLREKGEKEGPRRGFKLVVEGLDREAPAPATRTPDAPL